MNNFRRLAKILVAVLLLIVVLDWAAGRLITWRTYDPAAARQDLILYPAPYVMSELRTGSFGDATNIHINAQGFRHPTDLTSKKDRPRLFLIGASFSFGSGASSDATSYIQHLQEAFPMLDIVSAGGSSFGAEQQWIHLGMTVIPWQPDGILIIDGLSDIVRPMAFGQAPGNPWQWDVTAGYMSGRLSEIAMSRIKQKSNLYRGIDRLLQDKRAASADFGTQVFPEVSKQYRHMTELTYRTCQSFGIPVAHAFHPQLAVGKPISDVEKSFLLSGIAEGMQRYYPLLSQDAETLAKEHDIPFINTIYCFTNHTETLYVDYAHLNDNGQKLYAEVLTTFIKESGLDTRTQDHFSSRQTHQTPE